MPLGAGDISSVVLVSESIFGFDFERRSVVKTIQLPSEISAGTVDLEYSSILSRRDQVVAVVTFSDIVDVKVVVGIGGAGTVADRGASAAL